MESGGNKDKLVCEMDLRLAYNFTPTKSEDRMWVLVNLIVKLNSYKLMSPL